jgi:hypothetical protein
MWAKIYREIPNLVESCARNGVFSFVYFHLRLSRESTVYLENKERFRYRVLMLVYDIRVQRYSGVFNQTY